LKNEIKLITPDNFEPEDHFYPKALNSQMHTLVNHFFNLDHTRLIKRYQHLNPQVDGEKLKVVLNTPTKHFFWGGADLFCVTTEAGDRRMAVLETNSCPSGQKSMPIRSYGDEHRGYRNLIEQSFIPTLKKRRLPEGKLAVIYDKNYMETSGYAQTIADLTGEDVYLIPHFNGEEQFIRFDDGIMIATLPTGEEQPIRAAFRYVTQKPWNRIPVDSRTFIFNGVLACLSGGRNKLVGNKAYELFNSELAQSGLRIYMPETVKDVSKLEVPLWVQRFGGRAVVKNPYSNAGQGVYTLTSERELENFMEEDHDYDQFIVQSLIGHHNWSSTGSEGRFFHVGTVPDKKNNIYISDLRVMVYSTPQGFRPCALYARRAKSPMEEVAPEDSWSVLGTNLSVKQGKNSWDSETQRLLLMDQKDFNRLGLGLDDLIEAYVQTVLSIAAIDRMSQNLINKKGKFRRKLFTSLDNDPALTNELMSVEKQ